MKSYNNDSLVYYQFSNLARFSELDHAVFSRHGGFSHPPCHTLNVGMGVGDPADVVARNRERIRQCLAASELQTVRQVHGNIVQIWKQRLSVSGLRRSFGSQAGSVSESVSIGFNKQPEANRGGFAPEGDALVTNIPGKHLMVQVADCQPVLLYDPVQRAAACIHAGWRGSICNVIGAAIEAMRKEFETCPAHLFAGIGPSLGPCCAEFIHYREEIPAQYWDFRISEHYFDFWEISRSQLMDAGVPDSQIENSRMCTRCLTEEFYSYRGEGQTGRFAAVIGIRNRSTEEP